MRKKSGAALLELAIAVSMLSLVVFSACNLLIYSARAGNRQVSVQETLENGRIGLDFLLNQTRMASGYKLTADAGTNTLVRLDLYTERSDGTHIYIFTYDKSARRLNFGGSNNYPFTAGVNELASGINDVTATIDEHKKLLLFTVKSGGGEDGGEMTITGGVDIRYKKMY